MKREAKANPVPKNLFKKSLAQIEKQKQDRRQSQIKRVLKNYENNKAQPFKFKTSETTYNFSTVKQKYEEEENLKYQFDKKHARPVPDFYSKGPDVLSQVKPTAAAILREGHQLVKKKQEEQKVLNDFEMNMRDASEFDRWSKEMGQKEEVERLEHMHKKKIEMELARHEAIQAKVHKQKVNRHNAAKMKVEAEIREDQRQHDKVVDRQVKKELIDRIQDQRV
jgi:hypothetical protein